MSLWTTGWDAWRDGRHPSSLGRHQQSRLTDLVRFSRTHSPYLRQLYRTVPPGDVQLTRLPVTTKPELMAEFDEWVTDRRVKLADVKAFSADPGHVGQTYLDDYLVCTTSGTTGFPALLLHNRRSLEVLEACLLVRTVPRMLSVGTLRAVIAGNGRSASVWAVGRPFGGASLLQRQINQRPSRAKRLRLFSALTPVEELVSQLNAFRPVMLSAYASVLTLLAHERQAGRLRIAPAVINNGGETPSPEARSLVEGAFGVSVSNGYGCSEMIAIAFDCGRGSMHVHADWALLEPVDENFEPVPAGEPSATVLLTNLANRVQPVIRYNLGDSVTLQRGSCPCGSVLPRIVVVGRTNDVLSMRTPTGGTVDLVPLPLVTLVEGVPGVRGVQIVQQGPDRLMVRLDVPGDREMVWTEVESKLRAHLDRRGLRSVDLGLDGQPPQRDPRSGKLRQVIV